MVVVDRLAPSDRAAWEALFQGYLEFYRRTAAAEVSDRVYWMIHETNDVARRLSDRVAVNQGFIRYEIDL